ncbi:MAG: RNA polymerase sigma factor [Isosphaeraceae bacterium]|nr:RNA polymerase sigma factor [Isosphaeraceae bacterium]
MPEAPSGVMCDDETLVQLARGGDRPACEELFRRHRDAAYRVAFRLLGHHEDALDAVQEGFIKAISNLRNFDGRSGFRTWLMRIVHNAAIDTGRKRKRRPTLGLNDESNSLEPASEDDPAQGLNRQDLRRALEFALNRLSPTTRQTFILFAEGGLSYKEIAELQDVPIGTVMSRLHYARHKLQSYLDLDGIEGL